MNIEDLSGWVPHKPETWTARYASLVSPLTMSHYAGHWEGGKPVMVNTECVAGQRVKIVMVSRFGDVGITEDLEAENGYGARVDIEDLYDFSPVK